MNRGVSDSPANILVVDDEPSIVRLVSVLLAAQGHSVQSACDGLGAIESASARPIDLLVTDVRMHGMDGMSLARELALRQPGLKIIFMSGFFSEADCRPESVPGTWEYIAKPFSLPELLSLVNRVLGGVVAN